jgi:predicted enzyme related to lactoylglutathione lyase
MAQLIGKFVWFENVTSEIEKARAFYGEVLGWKVQEMKMGSDSYAMIVAGETPVGGFTAPEKPGRPHWTSYLSVADVDATARKITASGGKTLAPAFDVPTIGRMQPVADPEGATFWIMRGEGDDTADSPPAQGKFFWNELWARDAARAAAFYRDVFGFTVKEMAMEGMTYRVLERDGVSRAGIMTSELKDVPPMWLPYVAVDDCDATTARAGKLGATVHLPPTDIPTVGRFSVFADPSGATLAVIKPAA